MKMSPPYKSTPSLLQVLSQVCSAGIYLVALLLSSFHVGYIIF